VIITGKNSSRYEPRSTCLSCAPGTCPSSMSVRHVCALQQRVAAAEHERRAVRDVARVHDPDRRRVEQVARKALVADREDEEQHRERDDLAGRVREAVDPADRRVEGRRGSRSLVVKNAKRRIVPALRLREADVSWGRG
jgi:hypothetical protein